MLYRLDDYANAQDRDRAHVVFHQRIIVDCAPGLCPFANRRQGCDRRDTRTLAGRWSTLRYMIIRGQDRRSNGERRTRYDQDCTQRKSDRTGS